MKYGNGFIWKTGIGSLSMPETALPRKRFTAKMTTRLYTSYQALESDDLVLSLQDFLSRQPEGNFFQSPGFFLVSERSGGFEPVLFLIRDEDQEIAGVLMGVYQSNGGVLKSFLSRRLVVWGGPVTGGRNEDESAAIARTLLERLTAHARDRAIYIEFRNLFDTSTLQAAFTACGFEYRNHLNLLVATDSLPAVKKRMSKSRFRQIRSSLRAGASIAEPLSEAEIAAWYDILKKLYLEKIGKPLPGVDLFVQLWRLKQGKIFLVKLEGEVVGGIACPVFNNEVIYEWYVCGKDGIQNKVYPSVLATWAPIEYGLKHGFTHFDFLGAGRPEEDYGVRAFKMRFGGRQVAHGRYHLVVNKLLYAVGKWGLKAYQRIPSLS